MSRSDTARRGISLALAVLCLLFVPQLASAKFTSKTPAAAELTVGAARLTAPTAVQGTYTCRSGFLQIDTMRMDVTGVSATNPASVDYQLQLLDGTAVRDQVVIPDANTPTTLDSSGWNWTSSRVWTLQVRPVVNQWTGPWFSKTYTCPAYEDKTGPL